jgi:hypothetical protein
VTNDVTFAGDRMRIHFARFGRPEYDLFLKAKRLPEWQIEFDPETRRTRSTPRPGSPDLVGVQAAAGAARGRPAAGAPWLYDDQAAVVTATRPWRPSGSPPGCSAGWARR